jgi:hypothetical protein
MNLRLKGPLSRLARLAPRAGSLTTGLALALTMSGCPDGADLENPDRFPPVVAATGGSSTAGVGGSVAGAPAGGAGGATGGSAGAAAGSAGSAGMTFSCDVAYALANTSKGSCGISGCHNATFHYADLTLVDPAALATALVDVPAMHGDINCAEAGQPFRECMPSELPAGCPQGALLIDSQNFEASWLVRKLDPNFVDGSCGNKMPAAPGNAADRWTAERQQCLMDFFRSLVPAQ